MSNLDYSKPSTLSAIPTKSDMISFHIREEGSFPKTQYIAVCEYKDCTREFNGDKWSLVLDKRTY